MFLISSAALMYEISLSRLLAIQMWHHYAFLIISGALLGYGAAGAFRLSCSLEIPPFLPAFGFSLVLIPLFLLAGLLPFDPALLALDPWHGGWLLLYFLLLSVPFFLAGLSLNLLLERHTEHSYFLYAGDLLGAAFGCTIFFMVAPNLKEIEWLAVPCLLALAGGLCLAKGYKLRLTISASVVLMLYACLGPWNAEIQFSPYKDLPLALQHPQSKLLETRHDASLRIDRLETPLARFAPGMSLEFQGHLPHQKGLTLDGDRLTGFAVWKGESLGDYLHYLPEWGLYYEQSPPDKVLVLETLSGQQALLAKEAGTASVMVQTAHPLVAEALSEDAAFPNIRIEAVGSRTLLARTDQRFDRILVSIENSAPVGSTGMNPLNTDPLMTEEGIKALIDHLAPEGWLSLHRFLLPPPRGELRMLATVIKALQSRGWNPETRIGLFRTLSTLMLFVSEKPWSMEDRHRFQSFCNLRGYAPVFYPGMTESERNTNIRLPEPVYALAFQPLLRNPDLFHAETPFDLKPVLDDRPYFDLFLKWSRLQEIRQSLGGKWEGLAEAGLLVPLLFLALCLISIVFIVIPMLPHLGQIKDQAPLMIYFFSIGLAFMMVEIALLEKLTLFLGQPVYSFALILGGLLTASGIGSFLSRESTRRKIRFVFLILMIELFIFSMMLPQWLELWSGNAWGFRLLLATLLVTLSGMLMGSPFPSGLKHLGLQSEAVDRRIPIALAWGCNAFASVTGAAGALWIAQAFGQSFLFLTGAFFYGMALLVFEYQRR